MLFRVDPQDGLPIYEQLVRQAKFAIANGSLLPGEHVPSVRELATMVAVNPNTVVRAYRDLQTEGLLVSIRGLGLAVSADAPSRCQNARIDLIRSRVRLMVLEARHVRVSDDELRRALEDELSRATPSSSGPPVNGVAT